MNVHAEERGHKEERVRAGAGKITRLQFIRSTEQEPSIYANPSIF